MHVVDKPYCYGVTCTVVFLTECAIWDVDLGGPKEQRISWGLDSPTGRERLKGILELIQVCRQAIYLIYSPSSQGGSTNVTCGYQYCSNLLVLLQ